MTVVSLDRILASIELCFVWITAVFESSLSRQKGVYRWELRLLYSIDESAFHYSVSSSLHGVHISIPESATFSL